MNNTATIALTRPSAVWPSESSRNERLSDAIDEFYAAVDTGQSIDRETLLKKYADISEELEDCLHNLDFIQQVTPQLIAGPEAQDEDKIATGSPRAHLGDFRILRELGRGGMGVVYEAEQISLGRRVALKVLPFAAMLDKQQLTRFKNEARAAATLDHPNIVAIYSVGAERGVHYYAMQLIEGQSLAEIIAAMKPGRPPSVEGAAQNATLIKLPTAADTVKAALPTVNAKGSAAFSTFHSAGQTLPVFSSRDYFCTVARLGIQAAEALEHAHQNGILHRDIKPANLLLDDTGKLWITDFGLARIEHDAGMTMTGDLLGTLRYMSPEQALAKRMVVDHRSDIYSLGITLYELLTLQPAYAGNDRQELLRQIAFDQPRKPRQINNRIPRDLETIVVTSIEKQPADRYPTASDLADDLRQYLESRPIKAKPAGIRRIVLNWSRRHVAALWASAGVLLLTTLIVLAAAVQIARSYREAEHQREIANTRLQEAKRQKSTSDAVSNLLQEMLSSGDPSFSKGADYTVRQLLDNFAANFSNQLVDQPEAEIKLRVILGCAYHSLELLEESDAHFQRALQLQRTKFPMDSVGLADILTDYAWTAYSLGRSSEAIECLEKAITTYRSSGGPRENLLPPLSLLHTFRVNNNEFEIGDSIANEALEINKETGHRTPSLLKSIGNSYLARGRKAEAESALREALSVYRQKVNGDLLPQTAWTLSNLGGALASQGKLTEAEAAQREALTIIRAHYGIDSRAFQSIAPRLTKLLNERGESSEADSLEAEILAGQHE